MEGLVLYHSALDQGVLVVLSASLVGLILAMVDLGEPAAWFQSLYLDVESLKEQPAWFWSLYLEL